MKPFVAIMLAGCIFAQQSTTLSDSKIMGLALAGVSEAELIRMVSTAQSFDFDLRPESTEAMMKSGVSEQVIRAMAARENGGTAVAVNAPTASTATLNPSAPSTSSAAIVSTQGPAFSVVKHKLRYDGGSIANLSVGSE